MRVFKNVYFYGFLFACCFTLFLFVNCNPEDPSSLDNAFNSQIGFENLASKSTNDDNDVSDFTWDRVNWLHTDVSGWQESSEITSVEVRSNGQICINHTELGQWPAGNPLGGGELVGNPWVIVKIDGRYYAGTYEWLRPTQICKFGHAPDTDSLAKVYDNAWGGHVKVSPLKEWVPQGGDVVGFMVSGLARNPVRNVQKRTNIQWYRLPSLDGSIQGEMLHSTSIDSDNDNLGQCEVPNRLSVLQQVARDYPDLLRNSNNCTTPRGSSGNYDFLEKVLVELRKTDTKWGYYHRTQHNLNHASYDAIAYYCGSGDGNGSSDLRFVDVISSSCQAYWGDTGHENRARPENGYWKYPRTAAVNVQTSPTTPTTRTPVTNVIEGQCGSQPNHCSAGDLHPHPEDTVTEILWTCRNRPHVLYNNKREKRCNASRTANNCRGPHYKVVGGRCLPSCGALALANKISKQDHELQSGQCRAGWTRIGDSYEEAGQGGVVCCRKAQ